MCARLSIDPEMLLSLFQNGKAQEPKRNDSQTLITVPRGAWHTCAPSPVSVKCPGIASRTFSFTFEWHRSHTEWGSTTTLSSSAPAITSLATPPHFPNKGKKDACR